MGNLGVSELAIVVLLIAAQLAFLVLVIALVVRPAATIAFFKRGLRQLQRVVAGLTRGSDRA